MALNLGPKGVNPAKGVMELGWGPRRMSLALSHGAGAWQWCRAAIGGRRGQVLVGTL